MNIRVGKRCQVDGMEVKLLAPREKGVFKCMWKNVSGAHVHVSDYNIDDSVVPKLL